jgi:hypothetical protein
MLVCSNLGTSQDDQEAILPVVRVLALNSWKGLSINKRYDHIHSQVRK